MWLVTSQYTGSVLLDLTGGKLVRLPGGQVVRWLGGGKIRPTSADMQKVVNFHIFLQECLNTKIKSTLIQTVQKKQWKLTQESFQYTQKLRNKTKDLFYLLFC